MNSHRRPAGRLTCFRRFSLNRAQISLRTVLPDVRKHLYLKISPTLETNIMSVTSSSDVRAATLAQPGTQYVFFFGAGKAEGNGKMKDELGGKGAGLAEMTNAGLPVPPGFTIQTDACREYMKTAKVSELLERQMTAALARLEELQKQKLGVGENPLLVSVRSGAK